MNNQSKHPRPKTLAPTLHFSSFQTSSNSYKRKFEPTIYPIFSWKNEIRRVSKTKYHGVTVDDRQNWGDQFTSVKEKTANGLASLKKSKNTISQSQLMKGYYALVESHSRYANVARGNLSDTKMGALQQLQTERLI